MSAPPSTDLQTTPLKRFFSSRLALCLTATVVCGLCLWRGFWVDEYATLSNISLPTAELIQDRLSKGHLPLYFLFLKVWSGIFGISEVALRIPSMLIGVGTVMLFRLIAEELLESTTAITASWLLCLNQLHVWAAQNARPWAAVLFFGLLALYFAMRFLKQPSPLLGLALLVTGLLGLSSQIFYLGVMIPAVVAVAMGRAPIKSKAPLIALLLAPALLLGGLVWALASEQENYRATYSIPPIMRALKGLAWPALGNFRYTIGGDLMIDLGLAALVASGIVYWRNRSRFGRSETLPVGVLMTVGLLFTPVALALVEGFGGRSSVGQERYFTAAIPFAMLLLAVGTMRATEALREKKPQFTAVPLVFLAVLYIPAWVYWLPYDGDGPHLFTDDLEGPAVLVGNTGPFRYEFRNRTDVSLIPLDRGKRLSEQLDEAFESDAGDVWLIVYDNHKASLDDAPKQLADRFELLETRTRADVRGYSLRRKTPNIENPD